MKNYPDTYNHFLEALMTESDVPVRPISPSLEPSDG
jgi:hypothetical protein